MNTFNQTNTETFCGPNSLLSDAQFVGLAKIYKTHPCLWNENEIAYRFANRRREALEYILQKFNTKFELNLTKRELENEISRLRKICSYEKTKKIACKRNKSIYKPKFAYYQHLAFAEIDVRPFECSICGNLLRSLSQYTIHLASHDGSLPFKCIVCGHGFQLATNLTVHLRRHVQDYNYSCEVCNKSIATTSELKSHMRIHTGEKPYVCDICGKSFRMLNEFKEHLLRHEQRKIHQCSICPKAFYNRNKLRDHMASVHVKVRNKICNVCDKGFTTQRQLRQHQHIHDAEKKFECRICGKRFSQPAGLSGHLKSHGASLSANIEY
ncbi:PREDICTED: zinc finger protein OZF-like [Rhagoletis zephyria]|uniref:zinc finger protein OZF-like n=1 Tax=Rhagoletis zephyria TaxID=28612 RepID=UPI0008113044|nr:PREDICTED: zinc finger protein OZF-like [Rhagoletis zephyria]